MRIGYVGTHQASDDERARLAGAGCERIEHGSIKDVLSMMAPDDCMVVASLSALGNGSSAVLAALSRIRDRSLQFAALSEGIDTGRPEDVAFLAHTAALASLDEVRSGGRPKADPSAVAKALSMKASGEYDMSEIVEATGLSRATIMRYAAKDKPAPT